MQNVKKWINNFSIISQSYIHAFFLHLLFRSKTDFTMSKSTISFQNHFAPGHEENALNNL